MDNIKFTSNDIKEEISIQINTCIKDIKHLFETIGLLKNKLSECEEEILKLKSYVSTLNKIIQENQSENKKKDDSLETSVAELQSICESFKTESLIDRFYNNSRDRIIIIGFLTLLMLSLVCNCFLIYKSCEGKQAGNQEVVKAQKELPAINPQDSINNHTNKDKH